MVYVRFNESRNSKNTFVTQNINNVGRWWSSGQHAYLLLKRPGFNSAEVHKFSVKLDENKLERPIYNAGWDRLVTHLS